MVWGINLMDPRSRQLLNDRVDHYLARMLNWIAVEPLPTGQLVEMARNMDDGLRSGRYSGPRYRSAIAQKLLGIYGELQRRVAAASLASDGLPQLDGLAWNLGSPNAGLLEDIIPFGMVDRWHAIAASAPPPPPPRQRNHRPIAPAPAPSTTTPSSPTVHRSGGLPGHLAHARLRGGAQGRETGRGINQTNAHVGETADIVSRGGDVLAAIPGLGLAGAITATVGTIVSYALAIHAEHQRFSCASKASRCENWGYWVGHAW